MNAGGIRGGLFFANSPGGEPAGQVTYGELFTVQPFGNSLVVKTCTGAQIKAVLEQQFTATGARAASDPAQISDGFTYSYNSTLTAGQPRRATCHARTARRSTPATTYRVTMNSFLAPGGDGFTVFRQCTQPLGGEIDLDALVRYFQAELAPSLAGPQNRITTARLSTGARGRRAALDSGGFASRIPRYTPALR